MITRLFTAALVAAAIGAPAQAYSPQSHGGRTDILSELPRNAPPGECYARVKVPGERVSAPPVMQGAQWVMVPGPPGSPGPIWCLVPTGAQPVAYETPARYGWIRVLCDDDMTADRVSGVQRSLHQRGYYRGQVSGRYDEATSQALTRFQSAHGLNHGGYMSLDTLSALGEPGGYARSGGYERSYSSPTGYGYASKSYSTEGYDTGWQVSGGYPAYAATQAYGGGYAHAGAGVYTGTVAQPGYGYSHQGYQERGYAGSYQPGYPCVQSCLPPLPPPPPAPPCCVPPPCCAYPGSYGHQGGISTGYGYSSSYAASSSSAVQGGWLHWQGKSGY